MSTARLLVGNVLDVLPTLPERSVRCCVTSPPYWGLRDYGAEGQIGLEATPDAYVAQLVAVFREVRRVLTDDGTLWLNLGDSYARAPEKGVQFEAKSERSYLTNAQANEGNRGPPVPDGLKPKDLVGIPWRVAFALQADGWYLRSDIIWAKPNPMPESVTDRPTKAHEYLFLLAKSERYYYDAAAIAEPFADARMGNPGNYSTDRYSRPEIVKARLQYHGQAFNEDGAIRGRNARTVWTIATQPYPDAHFATFPEELPRRCILAGSAPGDTVLDPFAGSGTTLAVAIGNGRHGLGIELNPTYAEMARRRIGPMFCEVAA